MASLSRSVTFGSLTMATLALGAGVVATAVPASVQGIAGSWPQGGQGIVGTWPQGGQGIAGSWPQSGQSTAGSNSTPNYYRHCYSAKSASLRWHGKRYGLPADPGLLKPREPAHVLAESAWCRMSALRPSTVKSCCEKRVINMSLISLRSCEFAFVTRTWFFRAASYR